MGQRNEWWAQGVGTLILVKWYVMMTLTNNKQVFFFKLRRLFWYFVFEVRLLIHACWFEDILGSHAVLNVLAHTSRFWILNWDSFHKYSEDKESLWKCNFSYSIYLMEANDFAQRRLQHRKFKKNDIITVVTMQLKDSSIPCLVNRYALNVKKQRQRRGRDRSILAYANKQIKKRQNLHVIIFINFTICKIQLVVLMQMRLPSTQNIWLGYWYPPVKIKTAKHIDRPIQKYRLPIFQQTPAWERLNSITNNHTHSLIPVCLHFT